MDRDREEGTFAFSVTNRVTNSVTNSVTTAGSQNRKERRADEVFCRGDKQHVSSGPEVAPRDPARVDRGANRGSG